MNELLVKKIIAVLAIGILGVLLWNSRINVSPRNPGSDPGGEGITASTVVHAECEAKAQAHEKYDCYEQAFKTYMEDKGARETLLLLDDLNKLGGYVSANCHPLSHEVGHIALYVYGSVPAAAPEYLPVCHSGYYHGLLEEYLGTAPSYEVGVTEVCGKPADSSFFNWFQCTHGLGHGVMQFREDEVPQSLKDCDLLDPVNQAREICYGGVFMENITTEEKTGHKSKYIKPEDSIYPCNSVEDRYRSSCYFLSSSLILKLNGYDFKKAFETCDTVEQKYRWSCYQSMGRDVSGFTLRGIERSKKLCLLGTTKEARELCFFGAVRDFTNEIGEFDNSLRFCKALEPEYQQKCHDGIFVDLGLFAEGESFLAVCVKMDEPFQSQCFVRKDL